MSAKTVPAMKTRAWMIYGANGFTGKLIAEEARRRGYRPILAGRSRESILRLASELDLPARVFAVDSAEGITAHLDGVAAVLHCAGPFSATSRPMLEACMRAKAHYLDVTGEISVFESIHKNSPAIERAGISAIPGVGFDVVGSDCLAALLKHELPSATALRMGMQWVGGRMSKGTIKSMIEGIAKGGCVRRGGKLTTVPAAYKVRRIPFQNDAGRTLAVSIPWGDVSTAYYSTGIGDIEFYFAKSLAEIVLLRAMNPLRQVVGHPGVQAFLKHQVERFVAGPGDDVRAAARSYLWGQVENAAGEKAALRMLMPEGYTFTYLAALASMERLLTSGAPAGALTPSMAFGAGFAEEIPGVRVERALCRV